MIDLTRRLSPHFTLGELLRSETAERIPARPRGGDGEEAVGIHCSGTAMRRWASGRSGTAGARRGERFGKERRRPRLGYGGARVGGGHVVPSTVAPRSTKDGPLTVLH